METSKAEGAVQEVAGKIENAVGDLAGDTSTQFAGKTRELGGKAQQLCADTTSMLRDATATNPITTLAVAAAVGFLMGAIWRGGSGDR